MQLKWKWVNLTALLVCLPIGLRVAVQWTDTPAATGQINQTAIAAELSSHTTSSQSPETLPIQQTHSSEVATAIISASHQAITWTSRTPAAHRAQIVSVNPRILAASSTRLKVGDVISLDLFDGKQLRAKVTQSQIWGNGTLAVSAKIDGDPHGYLALSSVGGVLRVLATDTIHHKTYQLRYDAIRQAHVLLDVDEAKTDTLNCASGDHHDHFEASPLATEADTSNSPAPIAGSIEADLSADITTIDVLAIYTPAAKAREGGLANMQANISQSLLLGNQVLANSMTQVQVNLVHSAEVDYVESSSAQTDLVRIKSFDGIMDEVHTLRDLYAADFVVFFIDTSSVGGLGYRPTSYERPDLAFCLVRSQQSDTTSYTTIHEISHNMGNGHSKTQSTQAYNESFFTYAAGWQWDDANSPASLGYCSVMTYENFNSSGGNEYDRVAHLSNPDVLYNGNATGDPEDANAARVIRDGRLYYAAFREDPIDYPYADFPSTYGFELGDPFWFQSTADDHRWTTDQSGSTRSSGTGPSSAFQGSKYAYVEASSHNNETAILEADFDLSELGNPQISFAYHMYDADSGNMGSLTLEASMTDGESWELLWSVSGNQGSAWQQVAISLDGYAEPSVRLRFRGVTGSSYRSDIAIDSITIEENIPSTPITFSSWITDNYPGLSNRAPDGDSDGDGYSNFFEYALGLALNAPETQAPTQTVFDPALKTLIFSFPRAQDSVRYRVHSTLDLSDWINATAEWDSETATDLVPKGDVQAVEIDASAPTRFVRLNISEK